MRCHIRELQRPDRVHDRRQRIRVVAPAAELHPAALLRNEPGTHRQILDQRQQETRCETTTGCEQVGQSDVELISLIYFQMVLK